MKENSPVGSSQPVLLNVVVPTRNIHVPTPTVVIVQTFHDIHCLSHACCRPVDGSPTIPTLEVCVPTPNVGMKYYGTIVE